METVLKYFSRYGRDYYLKSKAETCSLLNC